MIVCFEGESVEVGFLQLAQECSGCGELGDCMRAIKNGVVSCYFLYNLFTRGEAWRELLIGDVDA